MSANLRLKAIDIIGQRKEFYRKIIPESSCAMKETVDIDILVTSRSGARKIMQSIRITSRPSLKITRWNQFIYQSNPYREVLSWLHFVSEPRVQERQQVKN